MELNWLEDFMELAAARNFSSAAATRHVTQPAFSRRIRALEKWVGTELVDRSSYPVGLTSAGETFLEACRDLLRDIYRIREECRQMGRAGIETIAFAGFHTIALNIFPDLLARIEMQTGPFITRMHVTDFYECVESLTLGRCDIALCYAHEFGPQVLHTGQFRSKLIQTEAFRLFSATDHKGKALIDPASRSEAADLPLIAYPSNCFLGRVQSQLLLSFQNKGITFQTVYENSMSEAVKRMVMSGKGIGWLPESAVTRELATGELKAVGNAASRATLEVLAIRKQGTGSAAVETFWSHL